MSYVLIKNETSVPVWIDKTGESIKTGEKNYTIQPGDCELFEYGFTMRIFANGGSCIYRWYNKDETKTFGNLNVKEGQNKNFDTKTLIITEMPED